MELNTTSAPVKLTQNAITELKRVIAEQNISEELGLRVGVKGGGCSGFSYVLGFDSATETDQQFDIEGITILMDRAHGLYLAGMEIDYHDGLDARGFVFSNPNAASTCGCGSSFSA